MQRIRDYSTSQLDRAHENYIFQVLPKPGNFANQLHTKPGNPVPISFQRQRLRKFSAQNYLKMRETGKYTQRTLNKVIESLPPLYLDLSNCRQGQEFDQEIAGLEFSAAGKGLSLPNGTGCLIWSSVSHSDYI